MIIFLIIEGGCRIIFCKWDGEDNIIIIIITTTAAATTIDRRTHRMYKNDKS